MTTDDGLAPPTTREVDAAAARLVRRGTSRCLLLIAAIVAVVAAIASVVAGSGGNGFAVAGAAVAALLSTRFAVALAVSLWRWRRLARVVREPRWHAAMVQLQPDGRYTSAVRVDGETDLQGYTAMWSGSAERAGFGRTRRWNLTPERGPGLVTRLDDGWGAVTDEAGTYLLLTRAPRSERVSRRLAKVWERSTAKDAEAAKPAW